MDNIRQALERARELGKTGAEDLSHAGRTAEQSEPVSAAGNRVLTGSADTHPPQLIELDLQHLEANRIIAHNELDYRGRSFDMLRTQVLQSMDQKNWKILGVTSPSPECGKTVTAINLALSIARQPERAALLVDLDLHKPVIAKDLGLSCKHDLLDVLSGQTNLTDAIVKVCAGHAHISVLPTKQATSQSSAWMTSREMSAMLQEIAKSYRSHTVVLDLPPLLASDDVIAVLPKIDCLLLVAAVGKTTVAEIEECNKHLQSTEVIRLVLNKVPNLNANYYYSYHGGGSRMRERAK